jgi:NAD(P)-dependent dehydrogenase (short-subunit alcohol dehydrogenase family)
MRGRTVLITGAARGIGAESALKLAARGANLALVGLEPDQLERLARLIGPAAAAFEADVTDVAALQEAVGRTIGRFGGIDAVVANAGVAPTGMVRSIDPAAFERTIEVNLLGVWRTVRVCLPHLLASRGYVLCIASLAAAMHSPGMAAYAASKAGVEAFAESLRAEVAHLGVDVGVGYFAFVDTEMVRGADRHPVFGQVRSEIPGPLGRTYPLSSAGDAVAAAVDRRKRSFAVPRWVRGVLVARGVLGPVFDRGAAAQGIDEIDAAFARDVVKRGAAVASAPVGMGGLASTHDSAAALGEPGKAPGEAGEQS